MKKAAYLSVLVLFIGIFMFYLVIDKKEGFKKSEHIQKTPMSEQEEYCLFKKGELREIKNGTFCIIDREERNTDDFFIDSLRENIEPIKLDTKKP